MSAGSVQEMFAAAGCRGWLCVAEVDGPGEVAEGADETVVTASVFKVAVALELFRQVSDGRIDPGERVKIVAGNRAPGPTGICLFADEVEASLRDLATLMLTISDNAATDVLLDRVGLDAVNATLASLGLSRTVVCMPLRELVDAIGRDAGFAGWQDMVQVMSTPAAAGLEATVRQRLATSRALQPERTIRTTAREMARLLRLIWRGEAGPADACAQVRALMARQVSRDRLAAAFPRPAVKVAAKSGSLIGVVRNEAGVIEYPDGRRYAAAVFTRANRPGVNENEINAAIGASARHAVGRLRGGER